MVDEAGICTCPFIAERQIAIACKGISHSFGSQAVLHDIDLDIGQGETFGLIGESGSGKSTLARIITGLQTPDAGSVELTTLDAVASIEQQRFSCDTSAPMGAPTAIPAAPGFTLKYDAGAGQCSDTACPTVPALIH